MGSTKKHDGKDWKKFGSTKAVDIKITDFSGNFESDNVEGALREASSKISDVEAATEGQKKAIQNHASVLAQHEEDIAWLKENGGGGGSTGNIAPTITSKFEDGTIVEKGKDVIIPIFFSSPNLGNGTAVIVIDGIEVNSVNVKAGNNNVNIGKLTNLHTEVSIYVKDRVGMLSNQLTWNIVCGGIDLTVDFDSSADYGVTDTILMQFNVTAAGKDPIIMHMTIDYDSYEVPCEQGHNEYVFTGLGVGIHKISFYITSGNYKTNVETFNIVVVNAESLYVSSTFTGGKFEYGVPIPIQYRISKMGSEVFDVRLELDGSLDKSLSVGAGTYYWTLNDIPVGVHEYAIKVSSIYGEYAEVTGSFEILEGEYTPLKVVQSGLIYRLNAKGRTNNDSDRTNPKDNSGNGVRTTLHNFNYFSNGWIDDALVCDGNAYVEIDSFPWSENAIYGSTIEIQFKGLDIGIFGSRIFDYTDIETPYKGAYIDLEETTMKSLANTGKINIDADTWITISFVIDRKNKFGKIFIDGICSRAFSLSDTGSGTAAIREDFSHMQKIYLNSRKGEDKFGACEIKDVRVYSRVLSDDEIIQNTIAQIEDLVEQKKEYDFHYNNTTLPTIKMYGDTSKMTLETPVTMRIKYTSPNEDKYGQSFDLPYCEVNWQGTSSLQYVLKNFTARLKDENMANYYYTPYPNGVLEYVYCFKCDYMESTHSRNAGLAKFVNECLYDEKNPAQLKNPDVRNSVNGFPTLLYINDELQGIYNFNLDRYSTSSFGYDSDTTLVYEVSANSDTTAGAFYKWSESSGKSKLDYYKSDFECLYPPTRAAGNDNMEELIRLVEWVNDSSDEDFKDNMHRYFNLQYLLRYFLYVYVVGAVDSLGKNMKLATWDGLVWYPQVYDADTTIGLDNTGFLKFDMDIEMGDEGVFNTTGSKLWQRVQLLFANELKEQYALMRQKQFTVDNIMKYVLEEQIQKIPGRYYNIDMQTKYLNFGSSYLYALHGSSEHHIRKWLRERLIYCDTLFGYNVSTSDYITLRSSKLGYVYLDIQTYIPMYVRVKWRDEANNTGVQVKRVARGETVRFEYNMPTATDQEIIVYAGYYLKSLGDVSNLQPTSMLIANASRLTEIECHSQNLINTDLSECTKLQRIDLSDSTVLGTGIGAQPILNIQNCKYLRYCNCHNTQLTAIYTMQQGGNLEELYYPKTTQVIQVTNQTYLRVLGIPYYCENLANVQITNCKAIDFIQYPFKQGDKLDFDTFKYVQNLELTNSLDKLTQMSFSGFSKLRNVTLSSLSKLEKLGFDDMLLNGETSTIKNVTISDCPLVDRVSFNVNDTRHKVEFATGGVIDISGLQSCKTIESNYSIKGLNKIILPQTIKNVYLSSDYGDGDNQLSNLWSSSASLTHMTDDFTGIDFLGLDLENFKMENCNNLTTAINFFLTPVNELPNLSAFKSLQGWVNFDRYVGDVRYMFKGINFTFENFQVIFNQIKPQTDITGLFQNAIITKEQFESVITKFPNAVIYDYFLSGSTIEEDYEFPTSAISVVGAFKDCLNMTTICNNWETEYDNEIASADCYAGCIYTRIDEIPVNWGGYGLYPAVTTIYELTIPEDNYTVTIGDGTYLMWNQNEGGNIAWGDGEVSDIESYASSSKVSISHTYKKAGTYNLKGKFTLKDTYKVTVCLADVLTKVLQEPSTRVEFNSAYGGCGKLTSIKLPLVKPVGSLENAFKETPNLTEIINIEKWNLSSINNIMHIFRSCGLTDYSFVTNWNLENCTNANNSFSSINATSIDISGWNVPKLQYAANMFSNSESLVTLNVSNLVGPTVTTIANFVGGDVNLETIIGMDTWDTKGFKSNAVNGAFLNAKKLTELNFSNWTFNDVDYGGNFWNGTNVTKLILNNIQWANPTRVRNIVRGSTYEESIYKTPITVVMDVINPNMKNFDSIFEDCAYVLNDIQLPSWTESCVNAFRNCVRMTKVHSNWDAEYGSSALDPAYSWWTENTNISTSNNNTFGNTTNHTDYLTSPFIELSSSLRFKTTSTSLSNPIRCIGYDENKVGLFEYEFIWNWWRKPGKCWAFYGTTNKTEQIVTHDMVKYVRIAVHKAHYKKITFYLSIPSNNCYTGCTAITSIDDEPVENGIDIIPADWGGNELIEGETVEIMIDTTGYANTNLDIFLNKNLKMVDWGDGTPAVIDDGNDGANVATSHTYASEGIYRIVAKRINTAIALFANSSGTPKTGLKNTLIEIKRVDTAWPRSNSVAHHMLRDMFRDCTKLKKAVIDMATYVPNAPTAYDSMFMNCKSLEEVKLRNIPPLYKESGLANMFQNCSSLRIVDTDDILANSTNNEISISNMFNGCKSMDNFDFIKQWSTEKIGFVSYTFAQTNITSLDLSNTNMHLKGYRGMTENCKALETVLTDGWIAEDWKGTVLTNEYNCFAPQRGCSSLTTDYHKYLITMLNTPSYSVYGCDSLDAVDIDLSDCYTENFISIEPYTQTRSITGVHSKKGFGMTLRYSPNFVSLRNCHFRYGVYGYFYYGGGGNGSWDWRFETTPDSTNYMYESWQNNSSTINDFCHLLSLTNTKWTVEAIVSLLECLYDYAAEGRTSEKVIRLGNNLSKLSSSQIAIATKKGWTLST